VAAWELGKLPLGKLPLEKMPLGKYLWVVSNNIKCLIPQITFIPGG